MPQLEELLQEKIDELEIKVNLKNNDIQDLSLDLNSLKGLIKNHRHQGLETISIEKLIKNAKYVDAKDYRISGTAGKTATLTVDKGGGSCTITVTNGIITASTC